MTERDPVLRRLERDAVVACATMAGIALAVGRGRPGLAAGVLAGGGLVAISYLGIKGGIDALVEATARTGRRSTARVAWNLVKFFTRYAILGAAAYVIMARLRLHPAAILAGASSLVIAAALEAVRSVRAASRVRHPR